MSALTTKLIDLLVAGMVKRGETSVMFRGSTKRKKSNGFSELEAT